MRNIPIRFKFYNGKISIICQFKKKQRAKEIIMNNKLGCKLGYERSEILFHQPDSDVTIFIPPQTGKSNTRYIFPLLPDLEYVFPPYLFLYCSIVTKTVIASTPVPLLKVIPVNFSNDNEDKGILRV